MYKLHSPPNKSRSTAFSEKNICIPNSLYLGLQLRDESVPDSGDGGDKDVPEEDVVEEEQNLKMIQLRKMKKIRI